MVSSLFQNLKKRENAWVYVPVISFLGIFLGVVFYNNSVLAYSGVIACIVASFLLGALAYINPKKDIVALLAPLYSLVIFNPWSEFSTGFLMQTLYALTILVVAIRFKKRFCSDS